MGFLFNKVILDMKVFDFAIDPPPPYCSDLGILTIS